MVNLLKLIFIQLTLLPGILQARVTLAVGDIILLPLRCHVCHEIEQATGSIYSHSGVVIQTQPQVMVAQALGTVHALPLNQFLAMKDPFRAALIRRSYENQDLHFKQEEFLRVYNHKFAGLPFDHQYRWNNYNSTGQQELYCSEFITKLLNNFLLDKIAPTPMDYSNNYEFWRRYFQQEPPQGEPGTSPSTFEHSSLFFTVNAES